MERRYDITVMTIIERYGKTDTFDQLTVYDVGETVKEWLADSCRVTLNRLIRLPEDKSEGAYHLSYRTVVRDAGTGEVVLPSAGVIRFPPMSREHIVEFQRWAVSQLNELISIRDSEVENHNPDLVQNSLAKNLFKVVKQVGRNLVNGER